MEPHVLCPNCARWSPVDDFTAHCRFCGAKYHSFRVQIPHLCYQNRQAHSELLMLYTKCVAAFAAVALVGWPLSATMDFWLVRAVVLGVAATVPWWGWRERKLRILPRYPEVFANPGFRRGVPSSAKYTADIRA